MTALVSTNRSVSRLLVVDDDPIQRRVIARIAAHAGYEVAEAGSVTEAEDYLATRRVDCVTVDLGLADGNGADVLHIITDRCPDAQVLIITGDRGRELEQTRRIAKENALHVHDVFIKPLDLVGLRDSLTRAREVPRAKRDAA
jgi:DNA-binding NtrC family response regulator